MPAAAYYNEIDPYAAQWLRNLIVAGHIAPGDVDERSIEDVHPDDLRPYTQCHFFAGIGVWSLALRRAGWSDSRPVWTGSCPCQPFSQAGEGAGFDDPRHLWPAFAWLIRERRPPVILGEQVASKAVEPWIDLVQADLEALDYAFGGVPFPSASSGAPHIRDRLFWVADAHGHRQPARRLSVRPGRQVQASTIQSRNGQAGELGNSNQQRGRRYSGTIPSAEVSAERSVRSFTDRSEPSGDAGSLADAERWHPKELAGEWPGPGNTQGSGAPSQSQGRRALLDPRPAGPVNGLWGTADWLLCRDGKWRPVEPSTFPLAHGAPARVGRLRAYGNALNAEAATQFVAAYLEATS